MGKHYEATKNMTNAELDRYMVANLKVGDVVRCGVIGRSGTIIAGPILVGKTSYYWVRSGFPEALDEHDAPMTMTVANFDIVEGM